MFASLKQQFVDNFIVDNRWQYLLDGLLVTLQITFFSLIIGLLLGFVVAVIRAMNQMTGKCKIADFVCRIYLTVIRGTPVVVQLMIMYFVVLNSVDKRVAAIVAFGINSGAYVAEIIRGGILAMDKGQFEAGLSLGFSELKAMWLILLPQALRNVLPALANEFIVLIKETSVAGYIAIQDLTKSGDLIRSRTYDAFMPLMAVALIYLALVVCLSTLVSRLEKRLAAARR
ncbi:MAG: amino acid ABC transporter permease [Myxococcaceae bacterium]|nr:amino acid ABC transporter permease [Myxococcaceae bacterium]